MRGCDITFDSKRLLTAGADNNCILWEMQTGKEIFRFTHPAPVLGCALAEGNPNPDPDPLPIPNLYLSLTLRRLQIRVLHQQIYANPRANFRVGSICKRG